MNRILVATSLGIMSLAMQAVQANAQAGQQRTCGPRAAIVEKLNNNYGETVQGLGLAANNAILEVYSSDETGSWTVTVTMPNGMMCLVASGQNWEPVQSGPVNRGEDA